MPERSVPLGHGFEIDLEDSPLIDRQRFMAGAFVAFDLYCRFGIG